MFNESCKTYIRYANTPSLVATKTYNYVQWAGHFVCNPDFYISRRNMDSILLIYTLNGKGHLRYCGDEYTLEPGSIALVNCRNFNEYYPENSEWEFLFIHFYGLNCNNFFDHLFSSNSGAVFEKTSGIKELIKSCIDACSTKTADFEIKTSKYLNDIFYTLILNIQNEENNKIDTVCEYIDKNYDKNISVKQLTELSGYSRSYFSTLFKKITGTTLQEYLLCHRLNKAKNLLTETDFSVEEIAVKTGFSDTGSFIRAFKRKEAVTPFQYKKSNCFKPSYH